MQPTTLALLRLFRADQALREAVAHLDSITKEVRTQESRNAATRERLTAAQARLKELQARSANHELDLKMREEHIEKLRNRQQTAANNKEYQALLVEINTAKVDRAKIEEATIKLMEQVETATAEVSRLTTTLEADSAKLAELQARVGDKAAAAKAEVDRLRPERDAAAAALKPELVVQFDRLAERFDGEAMAAIDKPNPREEEYLCLGCNITLVTNVFNQLKTRDDVVTCPSCRRILYIPDTLVTDPAPAKKARGKSERKVVKVKKETLPAAPASKWQDLVTAAQGESVQCAMEADHKPVECRVEINGEVVGTFKGKSAEHLEKVIRFQLEEKQMKADVRVVEATPTVEVSLPVTSEARSADAREAAETHQTA